MKAKRKGISILVTTPNGKKHHGTVYGKSFVRNVSWEKDRMRMFEAWSINPEALDTIIKMGVDNLIYRTKEKAFSISMQGVSEHGFVKEFSGGKTVYIPIKFWNGGKAPELPPAFAPKVEPKQKTLF